ncbi:hypothetical protein ABT213_23335 [Streptomyces sp. NPDC001674]|uniref:hypothetical protein n=1 Tax=Streptomyces sp. NPDC001674 TaxID=3154394 RepID=UPI00332AB026
MDRLELLLCTVAAVAVPLTGWLTAGAAHGYHVEARHSQLAARHVVDAEILADADRRGGGRSEGVWGLVR